MIEALELSMSYAGRTVVDRLSFRVERGELCAFLGPNGAGKSTTMRLLTGALHPSAGRARIDGLDVLARRIDAASRIGYLPEAAAGFAALRVDEFLRFCAELRGLRGAQLRHAVDRVCDSVHLNAERGTRLGVLSKGWRQRAWLAQALIHDPPVLILDEPTDGLDPGERRHIRSLLREVRERKAILLSTHVLEEAEEVADRAIIIANGRLLADAAPNELSDARGRLAPMFHRLTASAGAADAPGEAP